ncbi:MAG: heavy metal sensor histidine kinase [Geobacteraceae bacterium]|jgi:two-component system heavy metal sensor histidine kinase CusS
MSLKSGKTNKWDENGLSRLGRWSIAARLITLYTLSVLIILSATNALLYREMVKNLELKNDLYIRDEISVLRAMLRGPNSEGEFAREIELEHAERKNIVHYVRVLDEQGHILKENPQMETIIPPAVFPLPKQDYVTHSERIKFRAKNGNLYVLKALRTDISGFGGKGKVLQIAMDVSDLDVFLADYRIKMISMLVLGVVVSALAGNFLSRRGLRPLSKITQTAQQITANRLDERIDPKRWPKELFSLAVAFDSMLDRLEVSIEGLSHYSANLAHELRTPINNLMVEADIALSRPRTVDEYRKVIGSNMEEYVRLSRMIDSLLFLARTENAQTGLNLALMDLRKEIEDIAEFYSAVASDEGIKVTCTGEAALYADPVLFRRAVSNLLANAINYTPKEGEISISVRQSDGMSVEVIVSDTGCGIAQEHLPHIFDRFYRVPSRRKPEARGSGLGLAIVKSIMDLHGGAVEIQSELTRGTTVTMKFLQQAR